MVIVRIFLLGVIVALTGCREAPSPPPVHSARSPDILRAVREPGAQVVLVNMWATWCVPCREEFPDLVKLHRDYRARGLRVVFVSWDADADAARRFLAAQGVDVDSYIKEAGESDPKFIDAIEPRWSGAFPTTILYDGSGTTREVLEGKQSYSALEKKILEIMNPQRRDGHP